MTNYTALADIWWFNPTLSGGELANAQNTTHAEGDPTDEFLGEGDESTDIPADSIAWLLDGGYIEEAG